MNAGLLLLHGFVGAALVAHAFQKLLVFRYEGVVGYVESLGFRAPRLLAVAVIANELVGGTLLALGLIVPLGAALVAATMLVASRTDHLGKGWFITGSGSELVITNAVVAIAIVAVGGGRYAVGPQLHGAAWAIAAAVAAVVGAAGALALRRHAGEPLLSGT